MMTVLCHTTRRVLKTCTYRAVYLEAVDSLGGTLERRYQHSGDEGLLLTMEKAVLTGGQEATKALTDTYPERSDCLFT